MQFDLKQKHVLACRCELNHVKDIMQVVFNVHVY